MEITLLDRCTLTDGDISLEELSRFGEVKSYEVMTPSDISNAVKNAEILLCNRSVMSREIIESAEKLRYIGLFATGYNNVDLAAAKEKGIVVTNVPGYSTDAVAQQAFAFILQLANHTAEYIGYTKKGLWTYDADKTYFPFPVMELKGKVLGIFGFGNIGKQVAKLGAAFGMEVLVHSRSKDTNFPYKLVNKEELFKSADFLTMHCPLNETTANVVNTGTLSLMKPSAFFINTARGGLVDEAALIKALKDGKLAGAALDVIKHEPMGQGNPLAEAPNCIVTPHIGWAATEARERLITHVASNLEAFLAGKPINVVG